MVVQGVTGKEGAFWAKHMKDMGTQVVFGVTPGKEGQDVDGIPVYHSVRRGIKDHPADVAMLFVPPKFTGTPCLRPSTRIKRSAPSPTASRCTKPSRSAGPRFCGAMVVGGNTGYHLRGRSHARHHPLLD
ncbi:MAG: hypothetical protein ACLSHC_03715 [Bilophila wadsworthia]